jgi:hypothetical protein
MSDLNASMRDLVIEKLRRRSDEVIVGEIFPETAKDLLTKIVRADQRARSQADDDRAASMYGRLLEVSRLIGPICAPVSVARAAHIAIMHTWNKGERRPALAVVLGRSCAIGPNQAKIPYLRSPWPELVRTGLADPDDRQTPDGYIHNFESNRPIYFFFNADAPHSVIRWCNPAGDRTIVVMPPGYDRQ